MFLIAHEKSWNISRISLRSDLVLRQETQACLGIAEDGCSWAGNNWCERNAVMALVLANAGQRATDLSAENLPCNSVVISAGFGDV